MPGLIDISGGVFGRLAVLERVDNLGRQTRWSCKCSCGNTVDVAGNALKTGNTTSCGCWHKEVVSELLSKHRMCDTPEYKVWTHMKTRCYNEDSTSYSDYGGRGITVCARWLESFENFLADMGPKPSSNHSIDRRDNKGNYEKNNCRWATPTEQNRNKRNNRLVRLSGNEITLAELSEKFGIGGGVLSRRLNSGMSPEEAVATPAKRLFKIGGVEKTSSQWALHYGISIRTVNRRLEMGSSITEALCLENDYA